jgi:hypothetical protein
VGDVDDAGAADPNHWLLRLDAAAWLAAATNELTLCDQHLTRRAYRPAITHARRAAGMALNAVLVRDAARASEGAPDAGARAPFDRWGRSYMDHLKALPGDPAVPEAVRVAAQLLVDTPPAPPALVSLGKPDRRAHEAAAVIVAWCRG